MPHALIPLADVYESVIRRVAIDAISQLAQTMRLPEDTHIRLPGRTETVPMNNGQFRPPGDVGINYPTGGRLVVNFQEETSEETTLTTPVNTPEHVPIFLDETRSITVRPVYRFVKLILNLEYVAPNQQIAQRWLDEMRSRISMLRAELYQTLEYHYAIPDAVMLLLHHLYEKKEASVIPDGETFKTYLDNHLLRPTTTVETLVGTHPARVIKEKQLEVIGWFDFTDSPPQPEKDGNLSGAYRTGFTYSLHYNRPMQLYCRWPMLVHNNVLDRLYRPQKPYETFRQASRRVSFTKDSFESLLTSMREHGIPYLVHPDTDDWVPAVPPKRQLTFFSGLLVINPDQPTRLMDLFNLGAYTFTPYFLEYFYQQRHTLFGKDTSPFEFRLYQNDRHMSEVTLSLAPGSTVIQTDRPLDLKYQYHLQISIRRQWRTLDPDTVQCLRRYPVVSYLLFKSLGVSLGGGEYHELNLLGNSMPRPVSSQCPGEGSLVGPPAAGGTWPWPWLGETWTDTPWPGFDFPKGTWPGGTNHSSNGPWPGGTNPSYTATVPTWPGDSWPANVGPNKDSWGPGPGPGGSWPPGAWPGGGSMGVIRDKDMQDAIRQLPALENQVVDRSRVGPLNVLYFNILTQRMT